MQSWKNSDRDITRIGVLLFDGFSNHCLANLVEPLRAANDLGRRTSYRWEYLTVSGAPAQSSSGLRIVPDAALKDASGELLVVMPSYGVRAYVTDRVLRGLRSAAVRFTTLAGLDMGSWLLAAAGLLNGRIATIHWEELTAFAEAFPELTVARERYVVDGNRISCSGAMASFDLILHLIVQAHGPALALEVEQLFMAPGATPSVPAVTARTRLSRRAVAVMQDNIEAPLPLPKVAGAIRCSQRTLELAIRKDFDMTPQQLYRVLRLNLARRLAETTTLPLAEVALRCGYRDASAMTRAFRERFDMTPSQSRRYVDDQLPGS
ncbi:AraC family transcriptional regulator [Sulfitobacter alexandrii]|uniref:AraC family transcriptional regulator n=1 Tax=Sulfitobacter alexandrii TaxID=1917485 RepID=A0A1J0WL53_9RHOB|nr:GlxA family transcriptional regulator [Sulfitobacter alexandrii]APE45055.1 AraC family transcriptional regulator [Sulfitobacter alexandrii]